MPTPCSTKPSRIQEHLMAQDKVLASLMDNGQALPG
jgi:hypothetical protein